MESLRFFCILIMLSALFPIKENDYVIPSGEKYIIGEDGIKRIYINIWGHVKRPGTYLVYEQIDIMTALSIAGGPLDGADLSKIQIISKNNDSLKKIDIQDFLFEKDFDNIVFGPYDTINITPSTSFYIRDNAYLINVLLQLLTLGVAINN